MQQNRSAVRLDDMNRKKLEQSTDGELVDLAKQAAGQGAYAELVKRHHDRCSRRASSILSEPADAEDAVQEAFIRALLKLDQLQDPERFPGWLDRIVVSLALSRRRQHQPGIVNRPAYEAALDRLEDEDGNPERQAIAEEREDPEAAIAYLRRMIEPHTQTVTPGSQTLPRFPRAGLRIARLYRDALADPDRAETAFRAMVEEFPTSRLRDDALYELGAMWIDRGQPARGCPVLREVVETFEVGHPRRLAARRLEAECE